LLTGGLVLLARLAFPIRSRLASASWRAGLSRAGQGSARATGAAARLAIAPLGVFLAGTAPCAYLVAGSSALAASASSLLGAAAALLLFIAVFPLIPFARSRLLLLS